MIKLLCGRGLAVAIVLAGTLSLGMLGVEGPVSATPVSATTVQVAAGHVTMGPLTTPLDSQGCAGDTCMYLSSPSKGYVYIQAWAYHTGFSGYFHLTGPLGLSKDSSTGSWQAGKGNYYTFSNIPGVVGQYCVTGWSGTINEGTPCESVE